jgi:hypothetical protein
MKKITIYVDKKGLNDIEDDIEALKLIVFALWGKNTVIFEEELEEKHDPQTQ